MTKIIIDSNIAFRAILNIDSRISQILINGKSHYQFFAPETIRFELAEHKQKIIDIAGFTNETFMETFDLVFKNQKILGHGEVSAKHYQRGVELCAAIDLDDAVFVSVTEYLKSASEFRV